MTDTARPALPERTAAARLIVVIRGREADQYAPCSRPSRAPASARSS
jgi:hypothetical protein